MALTKTNITDFANDLIHDKGDSDTLSDSYDDVIERLAKTSAPLVDTDTFNTADGTSEYSYPTGAIRLLAIFQDANQIPFADLRTLEQYDATWRATAATKGTPIAWSQSETDARKFFLFPTPDAIVSDTVLFAEDRESDIPEWLLFAVACEIVHEELSYPSDHQDKEVADLALEISDFFKQLLGI